MTQEALDNLTASYAKELYDTYNNQEPNPWKTFDGRDVPQFDKVGVQVKAKWEAVARYAIINRP